MKYPVAIHKDDDSCFGVTVPDIPGCFSAGETIEEALDNAREAISGHLELLAEEDRLPATPSAIDDHYHNSDYTGAIWAFVDVDVHPFLGGTERATVTLPKLLVKKIDAAVAAGIIKNRSSFLAESALKELGKHQP
ncbi:type II toxin-antitoxin system HicB family antitoxin [Desulfosarcina sp. OttesenSCG-928-G10]|nr:type II toxin-antitoxin system HicB family antitoxin [Desulfosarcina sp. OttesenSCG-928-G10]MDL2320874.1 type II toxin-antitoxin system HicB family antitoxin [Desulfosarcina sp. OttesenSCG-928-B08]